MLFHEIYGRYFLAVAEILAEACKGALTGKRLTEIVREKAFEESVLTIPDALRQKEWPLLTDERKTPLRHIPSRPLTRIEEAWLKALLSDPKIRLFAPDESGLDTAKPLYAPEFFVYYDRYRDGDPWEDGNYIRNFRAVLEALRSRQRLWIRYRGQRGTELAVRGEPLKLEYSAKDDKFRLLLRLPEAAYNGMTVMNVARILECRPAGPAVACREPDADRAAVQKAAPGRLRQVTVELTDERDALERAMLHFSFLRKETTKKPDGTYRIRMYYEERDESEMVIQLLSFGPVLRVTEPELLREKIRERIIKQKELLSAPRHAAHEPAVQKGEEL